VALKGDPDRALALFRTYVARKGGDGALPADHPVKGLIEDQRRVQQQREEERRVSEEARRLEEQQKKQEALQPPPPVPH
jgi:Mrp family chromosome partitioning ATPase